MFFVRTAMKTDLPAVRKLLVETWHATYDAIYGRDRVEEITEAWHSVTELETRLARPQSEFLVADDGRTIGGMAYAARSGKDVVVIHQLYVHPDHQRQGVGRDLFAELETCFDGAKRMRLEVEPENAVALAFWHAHGFSEVGRTEQCGEGGIAIPALVMEKPLS
jgi:ribosomal protein S18 acetylase RimI-like enzyme